MHVLKKNFLKNPKRGGPPPPPPPLPQGRLRVVCDFHGCSRFARSTIPEKNEGLLGVYARDKSLKTKEDKPQYLLDSLQSCK